MNSSNFLKKFLLTICLIFYVAGFTQTTVTIGTGTGSGNLSPIASYYNSSASESIYLGTEIVSTGNITKLAYNKASGTSTASILVKIYMKATSSTGVGSTSYTVGAVNLANYTLVYDGILPNDTASGWKEVTLTTPFPYLSTASNLSVLVVGNTCISSGRPQYNYTSTTSSVKMSSTFTDGSLGCGGNNPWAATSSMAPVWERPNVRLTVVPPNGCYTPTAVGISGITASSATLGWGAPSTGTSTGYDYYISTSAATPVAGTIPTDSTTATTVPFTGLASNTTYYVWVRNDCGNGDKSLWTNVVSFNTLCVSASLPFSEPFTSATIPSCWRQASVSGTYSLTFETSSSAPTATPYGSSGRMVKWNSDGIASGNSARLVTAPLSSAGQTAVEVEFQWYHSNAYPTFADKVQVQYSTDGLTWINAGSEVPRYLATAGWSKKTIALPAAANNQPVLYVGFLFTSANGNNCYLDEVNIRASSACAAPAAATVNTITPGGAAIAWTAPSGAPSNGYDYYASTSSVTPASGVTVLGSTGAGVTTASLTDLTANTQYYVWVRSNCGTGSVSDWNPSATFTTLSALIATAGPQTNVLCKGSATGSATVNVTGGAGSYTYLWTPSGQTTATATALATGTYSVLVTDINGTTTTQSFTITEPALALTATAVTQTNILCNGAPTGSVTVNAAGGTGTYTYSWSPSGGTGATATNLTAGTYTVTVKDANLCEAMQSFTITQPDVLTATTTQVNILCNGTITGSATVNAVGGTGIYTYSWSPSGGTAATASGLAAGTYSVTITDANGCVLTKSVTITQPVALTATTTQTNIQCNGATTGSATVTVTGGTGLYTYLWAPSGGTAATATGLAAGTYTVTITDENLCTLTKTITIIQSSELTVTSTQTNVSCNAGSDGTAGITVSGGTFPYTYAWSPSGGTGATATGLTAGTYTVTVTDANGCSLTRTFTITQPLALTTEVTQTNVSCNGGNNGSTIVSVTGGTGAYTYAWAPSGGTAATATGLTAGNYFVTITDALGCQLVQNIAITEPTAITAVASQTNVSCNGTNNGILAVTVTGGTGAYTYSWTPAVSNGPQATNLTPGDYSVTITDANGCSTQVDFNLTQPDILIAPLNKIDVLCNGGNNGYAAVIPTGGTAPYTYEWTNGETTATINNLLAGDYSVIITDAHGCTASSAVTIFEPQAIIITAQPENIIVEANTTASFTVEADNTNNYQWQVSEDGENWTNITDEGENPAYSGATTNSLSIANVPLNYNGYIYRAQLGTNTCGVIVTDEAILTVSDISGVSDFKDLGVVIYPNPAVNEVFLRIPDFSAYNNLSVAMYDLNGRLIKEHTINTEASTIDIKGLESGVYILTVISDKAKVSKRIVVDRK